MWHVHGSWTTSFVQGPHDYLLPTNDARDADGRGRATTWTWPDSVREVELARLGDVRPDLVVLQRPRDLELWHEHTGRRAGRGVPAVYVEHNTPPGEVPFTRHPLADQHDIPVVHVTHFNALMWDCGTAETSVIEHGVVDPGHRYTGEVARAAAMVNEPVRRGRAVGTDLLLRLAHDVPVDVYGIDADLLEAAPTTPADHLHTVESLAQDRLHDELARHRVYVHTSRWTSLGLSLIEAMHLGLPVVALATTDAHRAVLPGTGTLTTDVDELVAATRRLLTDLEEARRRGAAARDAALARFGLKRFLDDWDRLLERRAG